jgi:hypothetical protein
MLSSYGRALYEWDYTVGIVRRDFVQPPSGGVSVSQTVGREGLSNRVLASIHHLLEPHPKTIPGWDTIIWQLVP